MKLLLNPSTPTRIAACFMAIVTTLLACYSGWAVHRVTGGILDFAENPQAFPSPDPLLYWLNDYYDRRFPPPPGFFKMHGEIDRVRWTMVAVFVPSALASLILLQIVVAPWTARRPRKSAPPHAS